MASEVVIVAAARTPIGSFGGALASVSAVELGAIALKEAIKRCGIQPSMIEELLFGNVLSANLGQSPARQVAVESGLACNVVCTTINKVCSSSLKATSLGAQAILTGTADIVAVAGAESMSNTPHYLPDARFGKKMGHGSTVDGLLKDGLWDPFNDHHMGIAAELCSEFHGLSREQQDRFACESYRRASEAYDCGLMQSEISPVILEVKGGVKEIVEDEEYKRLIPEKVSKLKPSFKSDGGTVTAANSSPLSDGGAAVILMSSEKALELGVKPLAKITGFADAEKRPEEFTTAPSEAIPKALARAKLQLSQVDYFEVNEAFSAVALANTKILGLDPQRVNVFGGAVSLGHPLGCSGARILVTLLNVLEKRSATTGVAAICNGGGGATAIAVERVKS